MVLRSLMPTPKPSPTLSVLLSVILLGFLLSPVGASLSNPSNTLVIRVRLLFLVPTFL